MIRYAGVVGLFLLVGSARAAPVPPTSPPDELTVISYAKDAGLSKSEALRYLRLQNIASELQDEVAATMPEIYGGLYIDHAPRFRVTVQLTDGDVSLIEPLLVGKLNALRPFVEVERVRWPIAQLKAKIPVVASMLKETGLMADLDIEARQNIVTVNVTDPSILASALYSAGKSLPEGATIRQVRELTRPLAGIAGGLSLTACTSGFAVIHPDGRRGILTAAHCYNDQQYYQGTYLPWLGGKYEGAWDVQWHSTPGYTPTNLVWNGSNYVSITGLKYRGSQTIGEYVCKYGRVTALSCGYIRSTTFAPSSVPNVTATWVTIGSASTYGEEGDSGAPIWRGNTAYGILHGIYYDYGYAEYRLVYMPSDGVYQGLGVYILVTP